MGLLFLSRSRVFRARPDEKMAKYVTMPLEKVKRGFKPALRNLKRKITG